MRWAKVTYKLCAAAFLALAIGSVRDLIVQSSPLPHKDKPAVTGKP
jgi:hypothetical protein